MTTAIRRESHRFFLSVALLLALTVFTGFARTYYLKDFFGSAPALPLLLHVHGLVMTLWFGLFVVQVALVARGRVALHRRLGLAGVWVAILAAVLAVAVSVSLARQELAGRPDSPLPALLLGLQLFSVITVFLVLVTLGVRYRRRPDVHKRLMTMAMLSVLGPAITRLPLLPNHNIGVTIGVNVSVIVLVVLADAAYHRRLHPAFGWGAVLVVGSMFVVAQLAQTAFWVGLVRQTLG